MAEFDVTEFDVTESDVTESDTLRRLTQAFDDIEMHFRLLALLPWTVHVDHAAERAEFERRASRERAERLLARVPTQRLPLRIEQRAMGARR